MGVEREGEGPRPLPSRGPPGSMPGGSFEVRGGPDSLWMGRQTGRVLIDGVGQLRRRHASLRWWREQMVRYPGGIVPVSVLGGVLGVSATRVRSLLREGRFTVLQLPEGGRLARFVPADELIDAPFRLDVGRPGLWGPRARMRKVPRMRGPRASESAGIPGVS
jgi:hypothetical protein